jgi:hypothetical protein
MLVVAKYHRAVALKPAAKGGFVNKNAKPAVQAGNKPKSVVKPGQQKTANAKPQSGKKPQQGAKPAPGTFSSLYSLYMIRLFE